MQASKLLSSPPIPKLLQLMGTHPPPSPYNLVVWTLLFVFFPVCCLPSLSSSLALSISLSPSLYSVLSSLMTRSNLLAMFSLLLSLSLCSELLQLPLAVLSLISAVKVFP